MKFSTRKCLLCGEGTPTGSKRKEDPLFAAWDDECISVLVSVLFQSSEGKEVEDVLRTAGYCDSCRFHLRDLSLAYKIISNTRRKMAKLVEKVVHDVSTHLAKISRPRKATAKGFAEAVELLFRELQEEDWTLQTFEYIETAVLRNFVKEQVPFIIDPLLDVPTSEGDLVFIKEEAEEFGNEGDLMEETGIIFPCDLPSVSEKMDQNVVNRKSDLGVAKNSNQPESKEDESLVQEIVESQVDGDALESDAWDCGDSDYNPVESNNSDNSDKSVQEQESDDEEYSPPVSKRRKSKTTAGNGVRVKKDNTEPSPKIKEKRQIQKSKSSPPKRPPRRTKQKPRLSAEKMKKSLEQFPISCRHADCYQRFRSEKRMDGHFNKYHLGDRETPYRCTLCNKEDGSNAEEIVGFKFFVGLQKHVRSFHKTVFPCDTTSNYKCSHCGKFFRSSVQLDAHVSSKHEKKSLHGTCDVCRKRFPSVEEMEAHKSKIHQGKYPFTCEDCNKIFASAVSLRHHVKQLHSLQDRVMCEICKDKSFLTKERLRFHEYANHPELRGAKFHCDLCDITFKNYYYYRDHRIEFHPELVKAKDYKCLECNKTYKRSNQLSSHLLRMHSSNREKTHKCSLCPKAFISLVSLLGHEERHSGLKYICYTCGSQFTSQSHLTTHMKVLHAEGGDSGPIKPGRPKQVNQLHLTHAEMQSSSNYNAETETAIQSVSTDVNSSSTTGEVLPNDPELVLVNSTVAVSLVD